MAGVVSRPGSNNQKNIMETITINYSPFAGRITHDRIEQYHIDALEFITDMYSPTQKIALLGISFEQLQDAVKDYYNHFSSQLKNLLSRKMIDAAYGMPFKLTESLDYLELEYKSSLTFKRLLANGKVPIEHIMIILEFLEKEYRYAKTSQ